MAEAWNKAEGAGRLDLSMGDRGNTASVNKASRTVEYRTKNNECRSNQLPRIKQSGYNGAYTPGGLKQKVEEKMRNTKDLRRPPQQHRFYDTLDVS